MPQEPRPPRTSLAEAIENWIDLSRWDNPVAITINMPRSIISYESGYRTVHDVDRYEAQKHLRHGLNRLDKKFLRHGKIRRGEVLRRFVVFEGGAGTTTQLHCHMIIDCPRALSIEAFTEEIRLAFARTDVHGASICNSGPADAGWVRYLLKPRSKPETDLKRPNSTLSRSERVALQAVDPANSYL